MKLSYPGIGGSLGECVVCGNTFLIEIVTGTKMKYIHVDGFSKDLPVHIKCIELFPKDGDWKKLPQGPLRREFGEAAQKAATGERDEEPEGTGGAAAILPETGMCGPITRGTGR